MTNSILVLRRTILLGAFATAVILTAQAAIPADAVPRGDTAPDALVRSVLTGLIESIRTDPSLRDGDFDKLQGLMDDKVAPHVDFERMTRLSVGPGWRSASLQQRKALIREFRAYALHTYSGALSRVADERLKVWRVKWQPDETDVTVRTEFVPSNGDPIPLNYRLEKTPTGWKMYDVTILGVSMAENFRNSFASVMRQSEVDDLISALADRNKELAAGNRPIE
jgi:phospholipid transport system substrate-binding protein